VPLLLQALPAASIERIVRRLADLSDSTQSNSFRLANPSTKQRSSRSEWPVKPHRLTRVREGSRARCNASMVSVFPHGDGAHAPHTAGATAPIHYFPTTVAIGTETAAAPW